LHIDAYLHTYRDAYRGKHRKPEENARVGTWKPVSGDPTRESQLSDKVTAGGGNEDMRRVSREHGDVTLPAPTRSVEPMIVRCHEAVAHGSINRYTLQSATVVRASYAEPPKTAVQGGWSTRIKGVVTSPFGSTPSINDFHPTFAFNF
jgi:hypothetical protein